MGGQKITRTVKKKFQQFDKAGKFVKGLGGHVMSAGSGYLIAKMTQNGLNPEEATFTDENETENNE